MRFILLLFSMVLVANGSKAGSTATVTVGSDVGCDYPTITSASFNEPASDLLEIRVAKNITLSSLQLLDDRETFIRGGYDTCTDDTPSGRTVLNGDAFSGAIFVPIESTNTVSYMDLYLLDLEITGGNSNTSGGVIGMTGGWQLTLDNVLMRHNTSNQDGGAIFIKPSADVNVLVPQVLIFRNSILSNNSADNGGAVACDGLGNIYAFNMQMTGNDANQNGGAVFVTNGCNFELYGGGLLQGIILNDATGFGGGIHASNNATIKINSNFPGNSFAAVVSNSAANGGGISVSSGATLVALDAVINSNSASSTGGGIRSNAGHVVIERTSAGAQCHTEVRCSSVSGNTVSGVDSSFSGGGAIATFGGTLEVRGTYIENNSAFYGSAIRARFMPLESLIPQMTLVGNVFASNRNAPQVVYLDETSADIAFSTFVDNEDMLRVIDMAYPTTSSDSHIVQVSGSIFEHPGSTMPSAELTTSGPFPSGDCNRNEPGSTGDLIGQSRSTTTAVLFEDQVSGDYRLQDNSVLIDWCHWSFLGSDSDYSANGLPRPIDHSISNLHGIYDLGGLERYELDLIFADDFD